MDAKSTLRGPRRGFTLIEMLSVVVIIGILAGLITAAAIAARNRARRARIKIEISQLEQALGHYKAKYGSYPPDFTDPDAVARHLKRAFPKCPASNYPDFTGHTPASALVFWLAGPPEGPTSTKTIGLSANVKNPFDDSPSRISPLFDFDQTRLRYEGDALVYYPDIGVAAASNPYVYFRARAGGKYEPANAGKRQVYMSPEGSEVKPYYDGPLTARTGNTEWVNSKSFQVLCAGSDDIFGNGHQFRAEEDYEEGNYDNITNFSNITLEDELP